MKKINRVMHNDRSRNLYRVLDSEFREIIVGNAKECANVMGITTHNFYKRVCKIGKKDDVYIHRFYIERVGLYSTGSNQKYVVIDENGYVVFEGDSKEGAKFLGLKNQHSFTNKMASQSPNSKYLILRKQEFEEEY